MRRPFTAAALLCAAALTACSPTFNWREVRAEGAGLKAVLPCKPDKSERTVPMAGHDVSLEPWPRHPPAQNLGDTPPPMRRSSRYSTGKR